MPIVTPSVEASQTNLSPATPAMDRLIPETPIITIQPESPVAQPTGQPEVFATQIAPISPAIDFPPYILQPGTPVYGPNFLQPELGCNWTGIGGQVFSSDGQPVTSGLVVEVDGSLEGETILLLTLVGSATGLGPGGFLIDLRDHVVSSQGQVWLQVFDLNGVPQTDPIYFDTRADCNQNLVIMNFTELGSALTVQFYLPLVFR